MQLRLGNDTVIECDGTVLSTADNRCLYSRHWTSLTLVRVHSADWNSGYLLVEEFYHETPDLCPLLPPPKVSFHATLAQARNALSNHDIVTRLFESSKESKP